LQVGVRSSVAPLTIEYLYDLCHNFVQASCMILDMAPSVICLSMSFFLELILAQPGDSLSAFGTLNILFELFQISTFVILIFVLVRYLASMSQKATGIAVSCVCMHIFFSGDHSYSEFCFGATLIATLYAF
jgi:hypothetical protein